jgi:hypothetical protein
MRKEHVQKKLPLNYEILHLFREMRKEHVQKKLPLNYEILHLFREMRKEHVQKKHFVILIPDALTRLVDRKTD